MLMAIDWLKARALTLVVTAALVSIGFISGCEHGKGIVQADWNAESLADSKVVTTQAVHVATVAAKSQGVNNEVSRYIKDRAAAISGGLVGLRVSSDSTGGRALPGFSVGAAGANANSPGCVPVERYNDLEWEAANTALMVEGWQLWYEKQRAAFGDIE